MPPTPTPTEAQPAPDSETLDVILRSVGLRPGETPDDREARRDAIRRTVVAFRPRDAAETALAGAAVLHLDAVQSAIGGLADAVDAQERTRAIAKIVSLDRATMGYPREFRLPRRVLRNEGADGGVPARQGAETLDVAALLAGIEARRHGAMPETVTGPPPRVGTPAGDIPRTRIPERASRETALSRGPGLFESAKPESVAAMGSEAAPAAEPETSPPPLNRKARREALRVARRAEKRAVPSRSGTGAAWPPFAERWAAPPSAEASAA